MHLSRRYSDEDLELFESEPEGLIPQSRMTCRKIKNYLFIEGSRGSQSKFCIGQEGRTKLVCYNTYMKKLLSSLILVFLFFVFSSYFTHSFAKGAPGPLAQTTYSKAKVVKVVNEGRKIEGEFTSFYQVVQVQILDGAEKDKKVNVEQGGLIKITPQQLLQPGDDIVLLKAVTKDHVSYTMLDRYRLGGVIYILVGFFILVIFIAGKKGFGSILGLIISLGIIVTVIIPQVLKGHDPVLITILGSLLIMFVTMYLAHGISKKITVAVIATLIALGITGILASVFVGISHLSGLGTEDSFMLQLEPGNINMRGLLLAGIIIGALGVLDDITTSQSATVFEIHHTDPKLPFGTLAKKGFNVGKEHIASLVNTLVLAYAGASLSLFILFVINPADQPYWVLLNSEIVVEEVIRTIAGSVGLVMAVPITTLLAAWVATSPRFKKSKIKHVA